MKNKPTLEKEFFAEFQCFKQASVVVKAINHELRQRMLLLLHKERKLSVTQILEQLNLEQSVASQQLALLRKAGLVSVERAGKHVLYSVNHSRVEVVHQLARDLVKDYRV